MENRTTPRPQFYQAFPHLTPEYFKSIAPAFRTPMPEAMPHRHSPDLPLCTSRKCLREATHKDFHCRMVRDLGDTHCYDLNGDFKCRSQSEGNKHCKRIFQPQEHQA